MINTAIKAAKEAGKILMNYYGKDVAVKYKNKYFDIGSILTEADLKSEEKIVEILKKGFPEHNIFSEEKIREKKGSPYTWYVDPLDGTSNFVRKIPLFGVSIGLIKNDKPVLGVLYFPALNLLLRAETGKGAFANGKRIKVSRRKLQEALYYSRSYWKGRLQLKKSIGKKVGLTKIVDATSFELAQIAMGNAELYILKNVLHDVAAGVTIVKEAGGKITDYDGLGWNPNSKGIVVSNGIIHDEVIRCIKK